MTDGVKQATDRIEAAILESLKGGSVEFGIAKVSVADLRLLLTQVEKANGRK